MGGRRMWLSWRQACPWISGIGIFELFCSSDGQRRSCCGKSAIPHMSKQISLFRQAQAILTVTNRNRRGRGTRILLASHSIICKRPMVVFVMRNLAEKSAMGKSFYISAAATSREAIGNPVSPPAHRKPAEQGNSCEGHAAQQMTICNYADCDLLIGMDQANVRNMRHIFCGDPAERIRHLAEYAGRLAQEVADPWYTGNFEATRRDVAAGCQGLLEYLTCALDE